MLDLSQLLRVPYVDGGLRYDIAPDGKSVVFAWNQTGRWELYKKILDDADEPLMISDGPGAKFSPRHSPDGTRLAYALDLDGSESYHIVLHDLKNGLITDLTPGIAYAHQPNFAWSPDGRMLAVLSDKHGQFAMHLLPADGSPGRLLKNIFHPCWDVAWSPDGRWIAIESESTASDRSIHIVPVNRPRKGIKTRTIQMTIDDKVLNAQHPAWSPDSRFLGFSAESDEWHDIGWFDIELGRAMWVNSSVGDDSQPAWSPDGRRIGWVHTDGAETCLQFIDEDGQIKEVQVGAGVHSYPQFRSDSILVVYEDPTHPNDLWEINLGDGASRQLTNSLQHELANSGLVEPEEVWYAAKDGARIPALLYRTENTSADSPAVISIHGGPNWAYQYLWEPVISHFAARGWTVLAPNYRGSTGYGRKWQNASRYDMGGIDTDDCAAGAAYLVEHGLADRHKIAVTGKSHGGYLTMTCLTGYPELWAAGSAIVPFLNWLKSHEDSREDLQHWNIENMGDPQENRELWIARSPYFFLDKMQAPVQMICGANDPRCPASESIAARDKLVELGKQVELLLYEGEGHTFLKTEHVIDSEMKRVEFLARALERRSNGEGE